MKVKAFSLGLALALAAAVALLPGSAVSAPARTDVVFGTQQEPAIIGLAICDACTMYTAAVVSAQLLLPTVDLSDKWEFYPVIAQKMPHVRDGDWKLLANGKMQVTWKLRRGFTWQDGTPLTAYDYVFAWRVNTHPQFPSAGRDVSDRIENIQAPDAYTLVVQWKSRHAFANVLITGEAGYLPRHILSKAFQTNPAKLDSHEWATSAKMVGTGPFRIVEWQRGASITLERWEGFRNELGVGPYAQKPTVRRITFRFISDTNTMVANVLAGSIDAFDITAVPFTQGLELEKRLQREARRDFIAQATPGLTWEHLDLNMENPKLTDRRVRQALIYAINREQMVQSLFEGKQPVAHSFLPPKHYGYLKNAKVYGYDPARANQLLDEAGWVRGSDGIRAKDGARLELTINSTAGNRVRESVQQILQQQWRAVGVELKIQNLPARVLFGDVGPSGKFEVMLYALTFSPISDCEGLYTSDGIPGPTGAGQNWTRYKNAEVDRLCHGVPGELDGAKRAQMLQRAQQIWLEDLPALPLYFRSDYTGHRTNLQNWKPTGSTQPETWNVPEWRFTSQ